MGKPEVSRHSGGVSGGHLPHCLSFRTGQGLPQGHTAVRRQSRGRGPGMFQASMGVPFGVCQGLQPAVLPPRSSRHPPSRPSNSCLLSLLQVNLVLGEGRSLGLTIRGGAEYGLGIYVTGVDAGSEAESSGLKVRAPRADFQEVRGEHGEGGRGQELGGGDLGFTGSTEREGEWGWHRAAPAGIRPGRRCPVREG